MFHFPDIFIITEGSNQWHFTWDNTIVHFIVTVDQRTKVPCDLYLSVFIWIPLSAISFLDLDLPFINQVETENPDCWFLANAVLKWSTITYHAFKIQSCPPMAYSICMLSRCVVSQHWGVLLKEYSLVQVDSTTICINVEEVSRQIKYMKAELSIMRHEFKSRWLYFPQI